MDKILYIHGLSSSGASTTVKNLRAFLKNYEILAPDLPINPYQALLLLNNICKKENPVFIIGTSMGAMFAQQLRGYKKILINPAFHVSEIMRTQIGLHNFLNPRQNGETQYEITKELCSSYESIESEQFKNITEFDKINTYALFGTKDRLVHGYEEYISYYKNFEWFEGEHRLNYEITKTIVVPMIIKCLIGK